MADIIDVSIGGNSEAIEAAFTRVAGLGRNLGLTLEGIGAPLAGVLGVALGGATVSSLIALGLQATELGKQIHDLTAQTGLTIDEFEALAFAADQNGSSADQAARAIVRLRDALAQAEKGSKDSQQAFAALGLDWRELVDIPVGDAVQRVARAMFLAGEDTSTFGAALDLLGAKNAPALQAALRELAEQGFDGLSEKGRAAGLVMGDQVVRDLNEANQAIENLKRSIIVFLGRDVIGGWQEILRDDAAEQRIIANAQAMQTLISAQAQFLQEGGRTYDQFAVALADYLQAIRNSEGQITEVHLKAAEEGIAAQRQYYEERGRLTGQTKIHIEGLEREIAAQRTALAEKAVQEAQKVAAETVAAEKTIEDAATQRARIVGEMLQNLADERVKPLLELMRQMGAAIPADGARPLDLYNAAMAHLNDLLAHGKLSQEQFAQAANLAADALAKVTTQRTPAEALAETLRKLDAEFANGQMSAEAYAQAVANAQAKFTTQRTAGEALAETYRRLRQEFDNGQMSQEAFTRAMQDATDKAASVKTPLEAYNARVRELNALYEDGVISQDAYTRAMEDAASSLREIKDPIEIYQDRLRDLKRMVDDGTISQVAFAKSVRDADEALGTAALNELNRQIGITAAGGNDSEARRAQDYIEQARRAAARGTPEGDRQAQWLIDQANQITGGGSTLEEVIGSGMGGRPRSSPADLRDSQGRDPWDLGYTGPANAPQDQSGAGADATGGMELSPDAAALATQLKAIAEKLGVFT